MILKIRDLIPKVNALFIVAVIIPVIGSFFYFGLLASDVYISESRFVVRSPDKPSTTGIGILLKSVGFSNAGDEVFAAQDYMRSRDALTNLNKNNFVVKIFSRPSISIFDRYNPLGLQGGFEDLYNYYRHQVSLEHDSATSITTLKVRAFTAEDAHDINLQLLKHAESMVNELNRRGRADLIQYAETEVTEAKRQAEQAALALAAFRNREGVVDPERQATAQLQMVSKLQDEVIITKTQLLQLQTYTPRNPEIPVLQTRLKGLLREIEEQLGRAAGNRKSLAGTAVEYQRLLLESTFRDRQLAAAMASLQEARNEARRKQAYIERIVQPNTPDSAAEPRRIKGIFATLVLGLVAWGISSMLWAGVREHRD